MIFTQVQWSLDMFGIFPALQQKLNLPFIADVMPVILLDLYCLFPENIVVFS